MGKILHIVSITKFACEKVPAKCSWILKVMDKQCSQDGCCIFTEIDQICGRKAFCTVHDQKCMVEPTDVFTAGFSCKTMSKLRRSGPAECGN